MPELSAPRRAELLDVLTDSKDRGFLGPGPVEIHLDHAMSFLVESVAVPARALDLGTGGGVPGLVLACVWPETRWSLLDSMHKRCAFLRESVERLSLGSTVEVLEGRAEAFGQSPEYRDSYDVVTARSFGPPAVTAECAVGFLKVGGHLVVSEPPGEIKRWPVEGLKLFGMKLLESTSVAVVEKIEPSSPEYPRKDGRPAKRPLF